MGVPFSLRRVYHGNFIQQILRAEGGGLEGRLRKLRSLVALAQ